MISLTPKEKESSRWPKLSFHSFPPLTAYIYLVTPRKAEIGVIIHVYIHTKKGLSCAIPQPRTNWAEKKKQGG